MQRAAETQSEESDVERPLWEGGYSGKTMLGTWVACGAVSVGGIVAAAMLGANGPGWFWLLVALVVVWLANLVVLAYRRLNLHYRLTDQRFFHEQGILKRTTDRTELIDIDDITFEQPLFQRIMGVGTILISSSDKTHPELRLRGIDRVNEVASMIDDARRVERRRRGLHIESI